MINPNESTRKKTEMQNRRQQVAEMYLRGQYQSEIADKLGVDQATVSRDLAELRKEWLDRSINHIDQKKAIELAKLDQLELTYWEAWERSKEPFKSKVIEGRGTTEEGKTVKQTVKTEERIGDPRFLDGVMKCIERRCAILGLDAPSNNRNINIDLTALSDKQLERLAHGEDLYRVLANPG